MRAAVRLLFVHAALVGHAAVGQNTLPHLRDLLVRGEVDSLLSRGGEAVRATDLSPLTKARLLEVMGEQYHQLSDIGEAKRLWDEAFKIRNSTFGDSSVEAAVGYAFQARYHDYMAAPQLDHASIALKAAARAKRLLQGKGTCDPWERTLILREFAYAFKVARMHLMEDSIRLRSTRAYFRDALRSAMQAGDTVWAAQVTHDIGNTFNDEAGAYASRLPRTMIAVLADSARLRYDSSMDLMTRIGLGKTRSVMMDHFTTALLYTSAYGSDSCSQAIRSYDAALAVLLAQANTPTSTTPLRHVPRIKDPAQMVELLYLRATTFRAWDDASPGVHLDSAIATLEAAIPYWEQLLRDYRSRDIEKVIGSYSHFPFRLGSELLLRRYIREGRPEDLHNSLLWSERNRNASSQRKQVRDGRRPEMESDQVLRPDQLTATQGSVIIAFNHSAFKGAFVIDENGLSVTPLEEIPASLDRTTGRFNEFHAGQKGWTPTDYAREAYAWYARLLKPVLEHRQVRELVIVPYGSLALLPFEALPTSPTAERWKDVAFLGDRYPVRYARSVAEAMMPHATCSGNDAFMATADVDSLADLPFATELIAQLHSDHPERAVDNDLSGAELIRALASPGWVHLASHAMNPATPDAVPFLLLSDGAWPATALHDRISCRTLAVISTCSSGSGRYYQGEGVMSMAHAFLGAGTKAVVHTLWPVDDRATSEILDDFYKALDEGLTASRALARSKNDFIRRHAEDGLADPFYWSGIVLTGADVRMGSPRKSTWWSALGALSLIAGGYMFSRRRRRSRALAET